MAKRPYKRVSMEILIESQYQFARIVSVSADPEVRKRAKIEYDRVTWEIGMRKK